MKFFPENDKVFRAAQRKGTSILIREIIDNSAKSFQKASSYAEDYNFEFKQTTLPINLSSINILMFDDKVVMVNFREPIITSVLNNKDYYENSIVLFEFFWRSI